MENSKNTPTTNSYINKDNGRKTIVFEKGVLEAELVLEDNSVATFQIWDIQVGWNENLISVPVQNSDTEYKRLIDEELL